MSLMSLSRMDFPVPAGSGRQLGYRCAMVVATEHTGIASNGHTAQKHRICRAQFFPASWTGAFACCISEASSPIAVSH